MITRNQFDLDIVHSVQVLDEYRLRQSKAEGLDVRWAVDIGAHIGSATCFIKQLWPEANVIAVEPFEPNCDLFVQNAASLQNIHLQRMAVIPDDENAKYSHACLMRKADGNAAASSTDFDWWENLPPDANPLLGNADVVWGNTIETILDRYKPPFIDLLKLDCEGAEARILEELRNQGRLRAVNRIVGEWHGFANIDRIRAALAETHNLELYQHDWAWGAFFASPK